MKYVLFYETGGATAEQIQQHWPAHRAHWQKFLDAGTLLLIGPFADRSGAMGVFTSRDAAEQFAAGDPFVLGGVIGNWHIREWMEAVLTS